MEKEVFWQIVTGGKDNRWQQIHEKELGIEWKGFIEEYGCGIIKEETHEEAQNHIGGGVREITFDFVEWTICHVAISQEDAHTQQYKWYDQDIAIVSLDLDFICVFVLEKTPRYETGVKWRSHDLRIVSKELHEFTFEVRMKLVDWHLLSTRKFKPVSPEQQERCREDRQTALSRRWSNNMCPSSNFTIFNHTTVFTKLDIFDHCTRHSTIFQVTLAVLRVLLRNTKLVFAIHLIQSHSPQRQRRDVNVHWRSKMVRSTARKPLPLRKKQWKKWWDPLPQDNTKRRMPRASIPLGTMYIVNPEKVKNIAKISNGLREISNQSAQVQFMLTSLVWKWDKLRAESVQNSKDSKVTKLEEAVDAYPLRTSTRWFRWDLTNVDFSQI